MLLTLTPAIRMSAAQRCVCCVKIVGVLALGRRRWRRNWSCHVISNNVMDEHARNRQRLVSEYLLAQVDISLAIVAHEDKSMLSK